MESALSSAVRHASIGTSEKSITPKTPITTYLLNLESTQDAYKAATTHPFLTSAGDGSLDPAVLKSWLAQDRLYALTYTRFISNLLAKIHIPTSSDRQKTLEWRVLSMLIDCLTNIRTELGMFEQVAEEEKWDAQELFDGTRMNEATREYEALFASASFNNVGYASGGPLGVWRGIVLLWATERCYFQAWRHARGVMEEQTAREEKAKGGDEAEQQENEKKEKMKVESLTKTLIPNWSSDEFGEFVGKIADLLDEMSEGAGEDDIKEAEDVWRSVLQVETRFWPDISPSQ